MKTLCCSRQVRSPLGTESLASGGAPVVEPAICEPTSLWNSGDLTPWWETKQSSHLSLGEASSTLLGAPRGEGGWEAATSVGPSQTPHEPSMVGASLPRYRRETESHLESEAKPGLSSDPIIW